MSGRNKAFTLTELLLAVAVLSVILLLVTRMFNSTTQITTSGNTRMDSDADARPLLNRLRVDTAQMVKRPDVDYYLKSSANLQPGNDRIAFYATVSGYSPPIGIQSPVSLVAYRINSERQMTRMAKGLSWYNESAAATPVVFLPLTIAGQWKAATVAENRADGTTTDVDYELASAAVFRFEYFYVLNDGSLSETPWSTTAGHTAVDGLRDVAAIGIAIATLPQRGRVLLTDTQFSSLNLRLSDFGAAMGAGDLLAQWQDALDATTDMPRPAINAVRMYTRLFPIVTQSPK